MKIEFPNGVCPECAAWLFENIGKGNVDMVNHKAKPVEPDDQWLFYRDQVRDKLNPNKIWDTPTIDIPDPRHEALAAWVALKWAR